MIAVWARTGRTVKNRSLAFVYDFQRTEEVLFRLCASNVFRVFLNGTLVAYGPRRSAHGYSNIQCCRFYVKDKDRLTVEVAGYNVNSYYIVDEPPFFAGELSRSGEVFADARDFRAFELNDRLRKVQRFSFQRPFVEVYEQKFDRGRFYRGEDLFPSVETQEVSSNIQRECSLPEPDFARSECVLIESGKIGLSENPWIYRDRSIDEIDDTLKGYRYEELECKLSDEACAFSYFPDKIDADKQKDRYALYDFSRVVTGFISCRAEVKKRCEIYFLFDEILMHEVFENAAWGPHFSRESKPLVFYRMATCNAVKYTLGPGNYDLLSFEPYNMRFLKVIVKGGDVKLGTPSVVRYENPEVYRTKFTCADPALEKIFLASQHTLSQNLVDVPTDCPNRERAGWLCDSFFSARCERLLTGENKVEENFLDALLKAPPLLELPDGMIPMCYPADHPNGMYIPNWAMWLVIELEDYVSRSGNRAFAAEWKAKIDALLRFFEKFENEDGLLEKLESWVCVEHSKAAEFVQDVNYPTNMLYSKMFSCVYTLYGDEHAKMRADQIARKVREQSFNGEFFEDNRVRVNGILKQTGNITETCQYYAFFTGVASRKRYPALYDVMLHKFGPRRDSSKVYPRVYPSNAFIGNYLRLLYFYSCGERRKVFDECKDYFLYMANRTGTLWEHDKAHASCDHAFAAYPAIFIVNSLTGFVRADTEKKVVFFEPPAVGVNCTLQLPLGKEAYMEIEMKGGKTIRRKLPAGYTVTEG